MKVAVLGLGYVGTVTAAGLAARGHEVVGVDVDEAKVDAISHGPSPGSTKWWPRVWRRAGCARPRT